MEQQNPEINLEERNPEINLEERNCDQVEHDVESQIESKAESRVELELKRAPTFLLSAKEARAMYLRMALTQYGYLRIPDYRERVLIKKLTLDLKKMLTQAQFLSEQFPNNYQLHQIRAFFDSHYKQLISIQD